VKKEPKEMKAEKEGTWTTLKKYGQETTFHGFKNIVQDHNNTARRYAHLS
jgi:hypothetical protein